MNDHVLMKLRPPSIGSLIEYSLDGVSGVPSFRATHINDRNRMSGHSKSKRPIHAPNDSMRDLQARMRTYLRTLPVDYTNATAYLPGCEIKKNVARHRRSRYFYLIDLQGAFGQTKGDKLTQVLFNIINSGRQEVMASTGVPNSGPSRIQVDLWFGPDVPCGTLADLQAFLDKYCLLEGDKGLPQGGPASQDLFNIYMACLVDEELKEYCKKHNLVYTRYGDDLTISSPDREIGKVIRRKIREILLKQGMILSHNKCEVVDIKHAPGESVFINGIRLCKGEMYAPSSFLAETRSIIRAALRSGEENLYHRSQGLAGCVLYIARGRELTQAELRIRRSLHELRAKRNMLEVE